MNATEQLPYSVPPTTTSGLKTNLLRIIIGQIETNNFLHSRIAAALDRYLAAATVQRAEALARREREVAVVEAHAEQAERVPVVVRRAAYVPVERAAGRRAVAGLRSVDRSGDADRLAERGEGMNGAILFHNSRLKEVRECVQ